MFTSFADYFEECLYESRSDIVNGKVSYNDVRARAQKAWKEMNGSPEVPVIDFEDDDDEE